jgi:uncharacterized Rmd1/YagE family protein
MGTGVKFVTGYYLAEKLDMTAVREKFDLTVLLKDSFELFMKDAEGGYIFAVNYGSVVFLNVAREDRERYLEKFKKDSDPEIFYVQMEEHEVLVDNALGYKVLFDKLILDELTDDIARIVMLNIAQSVALYRYTRQSEDLLKETRFHTTQLETRGRLNLRGRSLMKFIGRTLNIKNKIAENLYIFDAPNITWEDQELNRINEDMARQFDLTKRHKAIHENLNIVKENLDLFKDIIHHSQSSLLEWIIIVLILFEVVQIFI